MADGYCKVDFQTQNVFQFVENFYILIRNFKKGFSLKTGALYHASNTIPTKCKVGYLAYKRWRWDESGKICMAVKKGKITKKGKKCSCFYGLLIGDTFSA